MKGWLVKLKNTDRLGIVKYTENDLWEVRLLSGSLVIGHKDFFQFVAESKENGSESQA